MGCSATQSASKKQYKNVQNTSSTQSSQIRPSINIHSNQEISNKDINLEIQDNLGEYAVIPNKRNVRMKTLNPKIQQNCNERSQSHTVSKKSQFFNEKNGQLDSGVTIQSNKNTEKQHKNRISSNINLIEIKLENKNSNILQTKNKKLEVNSLELKVMSNINLHYKIEKLVAEGNFGSAFLASPVNSPAQKVVIKKILKEQNQENLTRQTEDFITEINLLKKIDHPFIVKSLDFLEDSENFYIVQEYLSGGTLRSKINDGFFQKPENELLSAQVMLQTLQALNYLHKTAHIIHRDIKPENFVFQDSTCSIIKLIDFGNATEFVPNQKFSSQTGTPYYLSPEVVNRNYNEKSDIWSLGIVFMFMMTSIRPYDAENIENLVTNIRDNPVDLQEHAWKNFSEESLKFAKQMLTKDSYQRPSAFALLKSDWLQKFKPRITVQKQFLRNIQQNQKEHFYHDQTSLISLLKQYILYNMIDSIPKQNFLISSFQALDPFSQGTISRKYITKAFKKFYPSEIEQAETTISSIFQNYNKDEQYLTYSEFSILATQSTDILTIDNLVAFFNMFCEKQSEMLAFSTLMKFFKINSNLQTLYEDQFVKIFQTSKVRLDQFLEQILTFKL